MQELVVLVNEDNQQIGTMPKLEAHNAQTPLHRAFSCYVFNQKGKFLLTRRALSKKVWPGVWTNSCCGHPAPGEKTEDAVLRRLDYELSLKPLELEIVLPNFRYRIERDRIVENEICPVYLARVTLDPHPNPLEVEDFRWIDWVDFVKQLKDNPHDYSEWSVLQVREMENKSLLQKYIK